MNNLLKTLKTFLDEDPLTYAASIAFYTVVSLPAILLIAVNLLSAAYETKQLQENLLSQLNTYLGPSTVEQANVILENANVSYNGVLPQVFGWLILFFSATTVFISLQNGINKIWGVKQDPKSGLVKVMFNRILSFAMLVSIAFVMLVSLVLDSMLSVVQDLYLLSVTATLIHNTTIKILVQLVVQM